MNYINDIVYNKFLTEEKLKGSKCNKCDKWYFPPRPICPKCFTNSMELVEIIGKGRLLTFTCIYVAPPFMIKQGFGRENPYCVGVVELDNELKVPARIEGVDSKRPETIKIGIPLLVYFIHCDENNQKRTYLAFKPENSD